MTSKYIDIIKRKNMRRSKRLVIFGMLKSFNFNILKTFRFSKTFAALAGIVLILQLVMPISVRAVALSGNDIDVKMFGFVLTGTFSSDISGQQTGTGKIKKGNVGAYPEGACIPIEIEVKNKTNGAGDILISPVFDYLNSVVGIDHLEVITTGILGNPSDTVDNLNDFTYTGNDLSAATSFTSSGGATSATVSGPFSGNNSGTSAPTGSDSFRHYNVTLLNVPADTTVYLIFCGRLGVDASAFPGASMSFRSAQGGEENVAVPVNQLLALPSLTLTKVVQGGSANPDEWSFTVSPAINGQSNFDIPDGQSSVTISNVSPDGSYTVTESGLAGYSFSSGSGTNCSFSGSTATASVAAGKPAQNASCTFTNTLNSYPLDVTINGTGSGTVTSDVAGINCPSDCDETYDHGTVVTLTATEDFGSTFAGWGGACSGTSSCVVTMDAAKSVTATFNLIPSEEFTLMVTTSGDGEGVATSTDGLINCDSNSESDCTETYASGTVVTLTAVADPGSTFEGSWSGGGCSGTGSCVVTMTSDIAVNANFNLVPPPPPPPPPSPSPSPTPTSTSPPPSGGGGGGGGGGSQFITPTPSPTPQVLGEITPPAPAPAPIPQPQVLGETLPRTGMELANLIWLSLVLISPLGFRFRPKKARARKRN